MLLRGISHYQWSNESLSDVLEPPTAADVAVEEATAAAEEAPAPAPAPALALAPAPGPVLAGGAAAEAAAEPVQVAAEADYLADGNRLLREIGRYDLTAAATPPSAAAAPPSAAAAPPSAAAELSADELEGGAEPTAAQPATAEAEAIVAAEAEPAEAAPLSPEPARDAPPSKPAEKQGADLLGKSRLFAAATAATEAAALATVTAPPPVAIERRAPHDATSSSMAAAPLLMPASSSSMAAAPLLMPASLAPTPPSAAPSIGAGATEGLLGALAMASAPATPPLAAAAASPPAPPSLPPPCAPSSLPCPAPPTAARAPPPVRAAPAPSPLAPVARSPKSVSLLPPRASEAPAASPAREWLHEWWASPAPAAAAETASPGSSPRSSPGSNPGRHRRTRSEGSSALEQKLGEFIGQVASLQLASFEETVAAPMREKARAGSPSAWAKLAPADWQTFDTPTSAQVKWPLSAQAASPFGSWTTSQLEGLDATVELAKHQATSPKECAAARPSSSPLRHGSAPDSPPNAMRECRSCPNAPATLRSNLQRCPSCRGYFHVRCFLAHTCSTGGGAVRSSPAGGSGTGPSMANLRASAPASLPTRLVPPRPSFP